MRIHVRRRFGTVGEYARVVVGRREALGQLVELAGHQPLQHRLVLLLHQPADDFGEIRLAGLLLVARLHAGDDVPAHEQMRDVVGVREAGILRLHVIDERAVFDVVVEPHDGGRALHSCHVLHFK